MAVTQSLHYVTRTALLVAVLLIHPMSADAAFIGSYALEQFNLTNDNADGLAEVSGNRQTLLLLGGNNGSGIAGSTDLTVVAPASGLVRFDFEYLTFDAPTFDWAGYLLNGIFTTLADSDGASGSVSFFVNARDRFGFRVVTLDNTEYPGEFYITNFEAPVGPAASIPEPGTLSLFLIASAAGALRLVRRQRKAALSAAALLVFLSTLPLHGQQSQRFYNGTNITGRLQLARAVNARSAGQVARLRSLGARFAPKHLDFRSPGRLLRPQNQLRSLGGVVAPSPTPVSSMLTLGAAPAGTGFNAISHYDQRMASNGNQFSVEPPNPAIAVANGFVLVGVNNAVAIYTTSGAPALPVVLSSNELFGVSPAIDQTSGANGVYPTDMRVFYDHGVNRWFVLQRAQDYDIFGNPMNSSRLYLAVSQTADPRENWSIYEMDTTNLDQPGCPCVSDYPQIGADQHGFYISVNEFNTLSINFVTASILAISKSALATSASLPATYKFSIPRSTGYEFTIHPATTPPGSSYYLGMGGLQYFVSTNVNANMDSSLGVWAMYNTASINTANPQLSLVQTSVSTIRVAYPDPANQRPGPLPYGNTVGGSLAFIDGGDNRIQSVTYAGSRLYVTAASQVLDDTARRVVGIAHVTLSPVFRAGALAASVVRQGYLGVRQNHLLRPALAVNARGEGAIAATLVGPNYYPSAVYVPFTSGTTPTMVFLAAAGSGPQDGFTGYEGGPARWGDYSTATLAPDGSVWMITEYIPNGTRSEFANWGTYVRRHVP